MVTVSILAPGVNCTGILLGSTHNGNALVRHRLGCLGKRSLLVTGVGAGPKGASTRLSCAFNVKTRRADS